MLWVFFGYTVLYGDYILNVLDVNVSFCFIMCIDMYI